MDRRQAETNELIQAGFDEFSRIFMIYDRVSRQSIDVGKGIRITATMAHMIEVIGKKHLSTVTSLSQHFQITKGAISQIVSRLVRDGFVKKQTLRGNDNEQPLVLTAKGVFVFKWHEKNNKPVINALATLSSSHSYEEIRSFIKILKELRELFESVSQRKPV